MDRCPHPLTTHYPFYSLRKTTPKYQPIEVLPLTHALGTASHVRIYWNANSVDLLSEKLTVVQMQIGASINMDHDAWVFASSQLSCRMDG
jgi:hypothetical protein